MSYQLFQLASLANLIFCAGIAYASICRLNTDLCRTHLVPRLRYALLGSGAFVCGLQPLFFGTSIAPGTAFFTCCVLSGMVLNVPRWGANSETPKRRKGDV